MIDTHIYDYDTYSRDTEMSTYLKAWERIGGKQFDVAQKKRLDLSQFYGENKYADGTDMEFGD